MSIWKVGVVPQRTLEVRNRFLNLLLLRYKATQIIMRRPGGWVFVQCVSEQGLFRPEEFASFVRCDSEKRCHANQSGASEAHWQQVTNGGSPGGDWNQNRRVLQMVRNLPVSEKLRVEKAHGGKENGQEGTQGEDRVPAATRPADPCQGGKSNKPEDARPCSPIRGPEAVPP